MKAAAMYGGVLAVLFFVCKDVVPQPYGLLLFFGLNAIQLFRGGVLVWNRMGLPYAASSMFLGGIGFLCAVGFTIAGFTFDALPTVAMVAFGLLALVGAVVLHIEAWANPERWNAWGAHMEDTGLLDIFRGDHIPELRAAAADQRLT